MIRCVGHQERRRDGFPKARRERVEHSELLLDACFRAIDAEAWILKERRDVLVPAQDQGLERRALVDRRGLPKSPVARIRIAPEVRMEGVVLTDQWGKEPDRPLAPDQSLEDLERIHSRFSRRDVSC